MGKVQAHENLKIGAIILRKWLPTYHLLCLACVCRRMCVFTECASVHVSVIVQARHKRLGDSVKQFGLFRECDDVESWISEKVCSTNLNTRL